MQINATHPWLVQPSQPELTGTEACLICGWFYILRGELVGYIFSPLSPISNRSECPGMNVPKLSDRQGLGKHSRAGPALQQEAGASKSTAAAQHDCNTSGVKGIFPAFPRLNSSLVEASGILQAMEISLAGCLFLQHICMPERMGLSPSLTS